MIRRKLPRTIRLDPSDTFVFEHAADPGEWAVAGSFLFGGGEAASLSGKARAAFRAGFLGVRSFGFSTLVVVTDASPDDYDHAVETLAASLRDKLGAPDLASARAAAREEIDFAASLCKPEAGTLIAMHRTLDAGAIREQFRTLERRAGEPGADRLHAHARAFDFVEVEDAPDEAVDLLRLREGAPP